MLDDRGFESRQGLGIFLFTSASRPPLGATQPPIQWLPGALSLGVKLTTHLHLVPRSRMHGAISPLPQYAFIVRCSQANNQNVINVLQRKMCGGHGSDGFEIFMQT
jgi:hypothetical protein